MRPQTHAGKFLWAPTFLSVKWSCDQYLPAGDVWEHYVRAGEERKERRGEEKRGRKWEDKRGVGRRAEEEKKKRERGRKEKEKAICSLGQGQ